MADRSLFCNSPSGLNWTYICDIFNYIHHPCVIFTFRNLTQSVLTFSLKFEIIPTLDNLLYLSITRYHQLISPSLGRLLEHIKATLSTREEEEELMGQDA